MFLYINYLGKSMEMFSVYKGLLVTCVINNLDGLDPLEIDHQCS